LALAGDGSAGLSVACQNDFNRRVNGIAGSAWNNRPGSFRQGHGRRAGGAGRRHARPSSIWARFSG